MRCTCGIGVLALALISGPGTTTAPLLAVQGDWETTEVADGVHQFRYGGHYTFFVVTQDGVIAFDPLSVEAAGVYAREIQRVAPGAKLLAIIYRHSHDDHATGAVVLQAAFGEVPIIAHANAVEPIRVAADPALPLPTITFTDRMTLHHGGRTLDLYYLGKSHTDNMLVALLREDKIAFAVDFVTNGTTPYRDLYAHEFSEFVDTLRRVQELSYETMLFGHDPPGESAVDRRPDRLLRRVTGGGATGDRGRQIGRRSCNDRTSTTIRELGPLRGVLSIERARHVSVARFAVPAGALSLTCGSRPIAEGETS